MYYPTVPAPIQLVDPDTDEVANTGAFAWEDFIRILFKDARVAQGVDMFDAYDARKAHISAAEGAVVPTEAAVMTVLQACAKRPTTFGPAFLYAPGAKGFVNTLLTAPTQPPVKVEPPSSAPDLEFTAEEETPLISDEELANMKKRVAAFTGK